MKKFLLIILVVITIISVLFIPVFAEDSAVDKPLVSQTELYFEKVIGGLGSIFGRLLNAVTFTDESRIEKAPARDAAGVEYKTDLFSGEPEQTLSAETWRVAEISFDSEKEYADPFDDVTLDLLLYGNGRLYTIPCFWDGGNIWRARFVCPSKGTWQCKT